MLILIALLSSLISAFLCFTIARRRHGNFAFWAAMGIAFGPLAIPFSFFSRARKV